MPKSNETVKSNDTINKRYGAGSIGIASAGQTEKWHMKRHFLSPQYTTNWQHTPKIDKPMMHNVIGKPELIAKD